VKWEQRGCYSSSGQLFEVHVVVEVTELITDRPSIPASAKDILPEHRREIIAVMRTLAERISKGEQR
jgi:hypothetical protein